MHVSCAVLLAAACLLASSAAEEKYTTRYDNVNLQEIFKNPRLFDGYAKCMLDKGPCTADGRLLRDSLSEALNNGCAKCSERQKSGAREVIKEVKVNHPMLWEELKKKHDPTGLFETKYRDLLEHL